MSKIFAVLSLLWSLSSFASNSQLLNTNDAEVLIQHFHAVARLDIENYMGTLRNGVEIDDSPCTSKDIILNRDHHENPGNIFLANLVWKWHNLYESLPYPSKKIIPRAIVMYLDQQDSNFFRYNEIEREWHFFSKSDASNIVEAMLENYSNIYSYCAPAA